MNIQTIITFLETRAPVYLQENYDNAGLLTGNPGWECTGIITTLDVTEAVVAEAVEKKCNLIVAHHPVIFSGLKKITGKNFVERTVISAIKNDIAIYAIHTNLDNVLQGVNGRIADKFPTAQCSMMTSCLIFFHIATLLELYKYKTVYRYFIRGPHRKRS